VFTLLFFDDWYLHQRTNLVRHIGQPEPVPDGTFEDPYMDLMWGYPTVCRDPITGTWRLLYQGQNADQEHVPVMAESIDGIHWTLPDLTQQIDIPNRRYVHQIMPTDRFWEWSHVFVDERATGSDEWLKALVLYHADDGIHLHAPLVTSPDSVHWRYREDVRWHPVGADPIASAFWNPYRQTYVLIARPIPSDRRITVYETRDWQTFSTPELALQPDALDTPCAEIYGMPVLPYEHMFIGFMWVFHTDPRVASENKYVLGKIDCHLAYSYNGWQWQRTVRTPLLANTAPGEFGAGCIYPNTFAMDGDILRIYSTTSKGEHAQIRWNPASHQGAIVQHTLRRDGFVYLEPAGGTGKLTTRLLLWQGGEPQLNVSAPQGEVRIQVVDGRGEPREGYTFSECIPFCGDTTAWIPEWREGRLMAALHDQIIRLQVQLANGRLYAIRGEFEVKMSYEARLFMEQGVRTPARPGF